VFRAYHKPAGTNNHYIFAVKQSTRSLAQPDAKEIKNEAEILQILDHPGVIKSSEIFQEGANYQLVLEYALNGDFQSFIKANKLDYDTKVHFMAQMVTVLDYLRSQGVVHRDLKPANWLIDQDWNLKLADFGSAQVRKLTKLKLQKVRSAAEYE